MAHRSTTSTVSLVGDAPRHKLAASVIMKKAVPKLRSEEAEREFWASHDSTDYLDWRKARREALPNLKRLTPSHSGNGNRSRKGKAES
jgi:CopG antitoxin of type II toxin-antitoxin system